MYRPFLPILFVFSILGTTTELHAQAARVLPLEVQFDGGTLASDGGLYLASGYQHSQLWKRTPEGELEVYADGLNGPIDVVEAPDGTLYVTCYNNQKVCKVSPAGEVSDFAVVGPNPCGITMDSVGNLFVTIGVDGSGAPNTPLMRVAPDATVSTWFSDPNLQNAVAVTVDAKDNCYVTSGSTGQIFRIDPMGKAQLFSTLPCLTTTPLIGYMEWAAGYLYVTTFSGRVWEVDSRGAVRVLIMPGTQRDPKGPPVTNLWSVCNGMTVTPDGRTLYMSVSKPSDPSRQLVRIDLDALPEGPILEDVELATRRGQWKRALALLERVTELEPMNFPAWDLLGHHLRRKGDLQSAIGAYLVAAEDPKLRPRSLYNHACALAIGGGTSDEALDALAAALDAGFNNPQLMATDPDLNSIRNKPGFPTIQ